MDRLDITVQEVLSLSSVLGSTFRYSELLVIYRKWLKLGDDSVLCHAKSTKLALDVAISKGFLETTDEEDEDRDSQVNKASVVVEDDLATYVKEVDSLYKFCVEKWERGVLEVLLGERKQDIHRAVAQCLEEGYQKTGQAEVDVHSLVKLFGHWKEAGDVSRATELALSVGTLFEQLGLHRQSINVYNEVLEMWRMNPRDAEVEVIGSFAVSVLEAIRAEDLQYIVKLHIAKGKSLANVHEALQSAQSYQDALSILQGTPAAEDLKDRSVIFPIFSGLFALLRMGKIEQDDDCTFEQNLVQRFVKETQLHGDPVHYTRALAMQGEVLSRLGKFREAVDAHNKLARVYNAVEHSAKICEAYGSDRSAQSFSSCALWHSMRGEDAKAMEKCEKVICDLLPRMELRNVHNTFMLLYPVMVVLKDKGHALRMKGLFETYVVQKFCEHLEGGFTFFLPLHQPIVVLLEVCDASNEVQDLEGKVEWVLKSETGVFTGVMDSYVANIGMAANSIIAEICLSLVKRVKNIHQRRRLIKKGLRAAGRTEKLFHSSEYGARMVVAERQNCHLVRELERIAWDEGMADVT